MTEQEKEFSFKDLLVPLTTANAIYIIIIVGLLVYLNSLFNGFVWEDKALIINNPLGHNFWIFDLSNTFNNGGQFRPVAALYSALLYSILKDIPFFYHFLQVILHIANISLLLVFFTKFFNKKFSLFLSLIFLIHPINVEAVSYIAAFDNPLSFLFGILAVLLSMEEKISHKRFAVLACLLTCSLFTREIGIIFFFIIIFYRVLFRKKSNLLFVLVLCGIVLSYFFTRFMIGGTYSLNAQWVPIANLPLIYRLINIPAILFYYIKTFFFPLQLVVDQQWAIKTTNLTNYYLPLIFDILFFCLIFLLGIYIYKYNKKIFSAYLFFFVWFLSGMLPLLQIIPLNMTVADHWFYFPMVGLLGLLGVCFATIRSHSKLLGTIGQFCLMVLCIIFSFRTIVRNTNWSDTVTLFTRDGNIMDTYQIENTLGLEYDAEKKFSESLIHFKKANKMFPNENNIFNIAEVYQEKGDLKNAQRYYYQVVQSKKTVNEDAQRVSYENLAWVILLSGNQSEAKEIIKIALQKYPNDGRLWGHLAIVEYQLHNRDDAIQAAKKAKILWPSESTTYLYTQISNNQPIDLEL